MDFIKKPFAFLIVLLPLPALTQCASTPASHEHVEQAPHELRPWLDGAPFNPSAAGPTFEADPIQQDEDEGTDSDLSSTANLIEPEAESEGRRSLQMGMSRKEVRSLYGTPAEVEVAGNPQDGNFRWIFPLSTFRKLGNTKIVTFEEGRVAGWETVRPD